MEADLDKIAEGDKDKLDVLGSFWSVLKVDLAKVEKGPGRGNKSLLKTETFAHTINGIQYTLRIARYGPVIEWEPTPGSKKSYVSLKPYLSFVKKDMRDIVADEVMMLVNLPRTIATVKGKDFLFAYGPYGFYGKWGDKNIKLTYKTIINIMNNEVKIEDLNKAIEYNETKKTERKPQKKSTK
jgi:topoisomerase IA-like protein